MALFSKKQDAKKPDEAKAAPAAAPVASAPAPIAAAAPQASPAVDPQQAQRNAAASQQAMLALGEIVSLLMRSPPFQNTPLGAVAGLVAPAIQNGQNVVARAQTKEGATAPIAACLWCSVSPEIDQRLSNDLDKPVQLAAADWKSGDIPWIVLYVGDRRVLGTMLERLRNETLGGKPLKMRVRGEDGSMSVQVFAGALPKSEH
jgi:hemolysin-activating ACP:hemolysin acyltransferase